MRGGVSGARHHYEKRKLIFMKNKNKKRLALTGGMAVAEALRQIKADVMPVYPITPQTPIIENFAKFQVEGKTDTELIVVESEHSAMSACVGSSAAGARTVTATSSQGLALMHEVLYIASGLRLPILMAVAARALSAPLSIHGDHSDVMGSRDAGWIQLFAENVQEAYDHTIMAMRLTEKSRVPMMAVMDGFITSHSVENLELLPDEAVKKFVGEFQPEKYLLDTDHPATFGAMALPDSFFEFKLDQQKAMDETENNFRDIASDFETISGRKYDVFEEYATWDAEHIVVAMGSVAGTIKEVVDQLRSQGKKVGLLKIKLFRPFPYVRVAKILARAKSVAVLDRAMSLGSYPPLYNEISISLCNAGKITDKNISSYVYGLGGRDIFRSDIEKVFTDLSGGKNCQDIKYIGIKK